MYFNLVILLLFLSNLIKWARHKKKRQGGKWLAFWQTHWFYSQVQEAVKLRCRIHGAEFITVSPRNTSQYCSKCGFHNRQRGTRGGKQFICTIHPRTYRLDADLNAARNIAQAQPQSRLAYMAKPTPSV